MTSPASRPQEVPRFLTEPIAVITDILARVEPDLDQVVAQAAIKQVARKGAAQRRLAQALHADPDLLTSASPEGPPTVADLIRALQRHGTRNLVLPRCAGCGGQNELVCTNTQGRRICGSCFNRPRHSVTTCTNCGKVHRIRYRDREGRPLCYRCPPELDSDHLEQICAHITNVAPDFDHDLLRGLVARALPQRFQRREVAWELDARPELLTGQGAQGSARLIRLIESLIGHGVGNVIAPTCPFCRRSVRLDSRRDGQRCCRACYDEVNKEPCVCCENRRPVATRTPDGQPICRACVHRGPFSQQQCTDCGRIRPIIHHDGDRALCNGCWRGYNATCSICGQRKPCHFAFTDAPRCENCSRRSRLTTCSGCGKSKAAWARTLAGDPLCGNCSRRREPCIRCGRTMRVWARVSEGALCRTCSRREPAYFHHCVQCGSFERLHHFGLCRRCAAPAVLREMLSGPGRVMRPEVEPVFAGLVASHPTRLLEWLRRPAPRKVLTALAEGRGPVTHDVLDQLAPAKATKRLREVLVDTKVLLQRDERLASLERWIDHKLTQVSDRDERKILRGFATWYLLPRLRARSTATPTTSYQAARVRGDVKASVKLLSWLQDRGSTLATCRQADIDAWLAEGAETRKAARSFLAWATARGYAHDVVIPSRRSNHTRAVFPERDQRWTLARHLLHTTELDTVDRVAGLLLLLYGQPVGRIVRLTTEHVTTSRAGVQLTLGSKPLILRPPLDGLLLRLVDNRRGTAVLGHTDDHVWLFPGGAPARPLSTGRLILRLKALGVPARVSRNSALMDLAAELPAAVLSQLLGLHINTAARWTDEAGNTRPDYAAELSRRMELGKS
jgi:hypothetical protein